MASREDILARLRADTLPAQDLPDLAGPWIQYDNVAEQFAKSLTGIGGSCHFVDSLAAAREHLSQLPVFQIAKQVASLVPEITIGNVDEQACDDPHQLETIDFAVVRGEFGVAENGAIWLWDTALRNRALLFITQHLVLVIPAEQIVATMHAAYERLTFDGSPRFGTFIAGPSKTADIEQSLVIGAHGPRSLTVYCVQS
ncbi:Lactate utilization protein C [Anatilimnocola aggregata]|uniref:Lactate utilization protein C n=1 Tax=Anatilimnocola aggregata TaxID=2528021 RepID=A0A517Y801_9BACT|nr:LUD domain-containing protein [Anatilimnocola aggregata]QDU26374.1 Lactate utilization protein C [Anatilimnocola aggregata]